MHGPIDIRFTCVCMYVCMYICMYVCMYTRILHNIGTLVGHRNKKNWDTSQCRVPRKSFRVPNILQPWANRWPLDLRIHKGVRCSRQTKRRCRLQSPYCILLPDLLHLIVPCCPTKNTSLGEKKKLNIKCVLTFLQLLSQNLSRSKQN